VEEKKKAGGIDMVSGTIFQPRITRACFIQPERGKKEGGAVLGCRKRTPAHAQTVGILLRKNRQNTRYPAGEGRNRPKVRGGGLLLDMSADWKERSYREGVRDRGRGS